MSELASLFLLDLRCPLIRCSHNPPWQVIVLGSVALPFMGAPRRKRPPDEPWSVEEVALEVYWRITHVPNEPHPGLRTQSACCHLALVLLRAIGVRAARPALPGGQARSAAATPGPLRLEGGSGTGSLGGPGATGLHSLAAPGKRPGLPARLDKRTTDIALHVADAVFKLSKLYPPGAACMLSCAG